MSELVPGQSVLIWHGHTFVQQLLVMGLKSYFKNVDDPMIRFDDLETKSKLWISSEYPTQRTLLPAIVLSDITGDPYKRPIGTKQEQISYVSVPMVKDGKEFKKVVGVQTGGSVLINATIRFGAYKNSERRNIKDYTLRCLREEYILDFFAKNDFHISDIKMGSATTQKVGAEYINFDAVNVVGMANWFRLNTDLKTVTAVEVNNIGIK